MIATDAPLLADASIRSAFAALAYGRDCVVTAADDGGYVLLGTRAHRPALFRDVDWGGPSVLAATRDRAARLGLDAEWPAPGRDVDDASDLRRLRVALRSPHRRERLPATAAALDSLSTTVI